MKLWQRAPLWRRATRTVGRVLFRIAENNDDPQLERNGEKWLLRELLTRHARSQDPAPFVLFDGGANAGDYTRVALRIAQEVHCRIELHAFEPSAHCVERLRREHAGNPAVRIVPAALSDRAGQASLHQGGSGSSQASLVIRDAGGVNPSASVTVPLLRLEDYLREQAIARVHFLKLDVEGSELPALLGLGDQLRPERVDVVQFEYGGTALDAGVTLREFYTLLEKRGYLITKLFPAALEMRSYRVWMEHYAYANYVAVAPRWRDLPVA